MSLSLLQTATAMNTNLTLPFSAVGGTEPYVYSVVPGGAGGSINSSTGLYLSPDVTGSDTIKVIDALSAEATADILVCDPIELFCDVLKHEMGLSDDQVYLYNQKFVTPNDSRIYLIVGFLMSKPFSNSLRFDGSVSGLNTIQSTNISSTLNIDIFSRGPTARTRIGELIMALQSEYSQSQQFLNGFRIYPISTRFHNLSYLDGSAIPFRFNLNVNIQYFVSKTIPVEYYDSFSDPDIAVNQ